MARARKPNSVHQLQGTYRPSVHGERDTVETGIPDKPEYLSARASRVWDRTVPLLDAVGFLAYAEGDALARYCELQAEFEENPREMVTPRISLLRSMANDFGLSPCSRDKVPVRPKEQKNKFADIA